MRIEAQATGILSDMSDQQIDQQFAYWNETFTDWADALENEQELFIDPYVLRDIADFFSQAMVAR